mmetsp:Transcript_20002/g.76698  ORF Transcript_20002/g.76698 Transcript_20002/m.76698 type:complete len:206 (+) Transcript_20002:930-1547(+)
MNPAENARDALQTREPGGVACHLPQHAPDGRSPPPLRSNRGAKRPQLLNPIAAVHRKHGNVAVSFQGGPGCRNSFDSQPRPRVGAAPKEADPVMDAVVAFFGVRVVRFGVQVCGRLSCHGVVAKDDESDRRHLLAASSARGTPLRQGRPFVNVAPRPGASPLQPVAFEGWRSAVHRGCCRARPARARGEGGPVGPLAAFEGPSSS